MSHPVSADTGGRTTKGEIDMANPFPPNQGNDPYQQQPQQPYGYPGQPPFAAPLAYYPEQSQATTILVFGILGLVMCQLFSPFAWSMGKKELAAIDAGRRPPTGRDHANIGRILGIVGTALLALVFIPLIIFAILSVVLATSSAG